MAKVRITGVSAPWFGVSWEYRESDAEVVRRVFSFLEDRRVLSEPLNAQLFIYVPQSAATIRQMLTQELGSGTVGGQLSRSLRDIRAAVRKFMDDLDHFAQRNVQGLLHEPELRNEQILALGEMRGHVHPILAFLANKYNVEVEEELALAIQPPTPASDD